MLDTLIANVTVVTLNEKMEVLVGAYLGVTDGKIAYIGKTAPEEQPQTILDGTGMVAMPGFVNCHTHLGATVLRNISDDASRRDALEQQLNLQDKLDRRSVKASVSLGIAECLRFGITSVSDLYYYPEVTAQVAADSGIKANVALSSYRFIDHSEDFDFEADEQCIEQVRLAKKWHGFGDGQLRVDAGLYAEYTSNYKLWEALGAWAAEEGLGLQLHLAETQAESEDCEERTGLGVAELLSSHNLFVPGTAAVGCVGLSEMERKILGKKKVSAVATPVAYSKMGLSGTPILECAKAGMNVALGTGGANEGGNMDMFQVMRWAAMGGRLLGGDADKMPAAAVLMMATTCGARAQGREESCGMLKVGMDADVILVDFTAPHLMPCHDVMNALVFSATGADVAMTMVRGKILYQNGQFPTLDMGKVVSEMMEYAIPKLMKEEV